MNCFDEKTFESSVKLVSHTQCGKVHQNAITPKKFPSNHTTKICEILTLQMDDFLPLGGISGLFTLNEFERTGFLLHFIVKNIFLD